MGAFAFVLLFPVVVAAATAKEAATVKQTSRPNILLIMADDLGFSDLGCYGGEIQTPHLDALADEGLRFSQFYNTGRCWPTRGSLLSGYYAQQIRRDYLPGVPTGGGNRGQRPRWAALLPKMLGEVGYRCYHTGKWHIDGKPIDSGFDTSAVDQVGRYFQPKKSAGNRPKQRLDFRDDFYLTSAMADDAVEKLQQHQAQHDDQPFFQYLAFTAPHFPLHALPEDIAIYADTYQAGWDAIRQQRWARMLQLGLLDRNANPRPSRVEQRLGPPYHFPEAFEILGPGETNRPLPWNRLSENQQAFQAAKMSIHAAMIHRMDIAIGRVLDQVRAMDRWEDTIVMFLSDNGASAEIMVRGDGHDPAEPLGSGLTYLCLGPGWSTACNTPFRRHKTWTHEGGISTPFIISWPRQIKDSGQIRRSPQHVIDVAATLLQVTGAKHPDAAPTPPGESFLNQLAASSEEPPEKRSLWWYHDGHRALRKGDWKAVSAEGEPWELYNLSSDRIESTDLAIAQADTLEELVGRWNAELDSFVELAKRDLTPKELSQSVPSAHRTGKMWDAQQAARIKRTQVLPSGETFRVADRHAFLLKPDQPAKAVTGMPWVFYAPTLAPLPDRLETWMHQKLLDAGVAVAGIDVGEAYGSPQSQRQFDALYDEMVRRGYSRKPALLGRSRGGLYVTRFAIEHPDRVSGIAGIYPVIDYTSYPGVDIAAAAYGVPAEKLSEQQDKYNPVKKVGVIAAADIPVYLIHGDVDKLVPLGPNSGAFTETYRRAGKESLITLETLPGQGHNGFVGFFQSDKLVQFLIRSARSG